jgi:hypothetical protein
MYKSNPMVNFHQFQEKYEKTSISLWEDIAGGTNPLSGCEVPF